MVELLPLRFVEEVRQHEKEDCIIFLDDFGAADPYQQRIALALTTYRAIGDAALPPSARLVIATNREEDAAYVITPSYAILNRVKHYNLVPKFEDWVSWMHRHYSKTKPTLLELVVSFLTAYPSHFCWTPETAIRKRTAAYPTPRSWANFIANTPEEAIQNPKELGQRCSFWVGKETATEFYKFCLIPQDEVKAILRNPKLIRQKNRVWQILFINHIIETMYKSGKAIDTKGLEDLLKNVSNDVLAAVLPNLQGNPELEGLRAQLSLQIVSGEENRLKIRPTILWSVTPNNLRKCLQPRMIEQFQVGRYHNDGALIKRRTENLHRYTDRWLLQPEKGSVRLTNKANISDDELP
jgi:hypothetical protein